MDRVISELYQKGTFLQWNYRKMSIPLSFSDNSFVKFHGDKNLETNSAMLYPCYNKLCYKGFGCGHALYRSQQLFKHVQMISCLPMLNSSQKRIKCLAQEHNTVPPTSLKLVTPCSQVYHSTAELTCSSNGL